LSLVEESIIAHFSDVFSYQHNPEFSVA
jgi:hypothetical protein